MQPKTCPTTRIRSAAALTASLTSALFLALLLTTFLGGCATPVRALSHRPAEGLPSAAGGSSSAAVFAGPAVAQAMQGVELATLPEYRRNDRHLSHRPVEPYRAVDDWPQPGIPDAFRTRRIFISTSDRSFTVFGSQPDRRRGPAIRRSPAPFRRPIY